MANEKTPSEVNPASIASKPGVLVDSNYNDVSSSKSSEAKPSMVSLVILTTTLATMTMLNFRSYSTWRTLRRLKGLPAKSPPGHRGFAYWHFLSRVMLTQNQLRQIGRNMKEQGPRGLVRGVIDNLGSGMKLKARVFEEVLEREAQEQLAELQHRASAVKGVGGGKEAGDEEKQRKLRNMIKRGRKGSVS